MPALLLAGSLQEAVGVLAVEPPWDADPVACCEDEDDVTTVSPGKLPPAPLAAACDDCDARGPCSSGWCRWKL